VPVDEQRRGGGALLPWEAPFPAVEVAVDDPLQPRFDRSEFWFCEAPGSWWRSLALGNTTQVSLVEGAMADFLEQLNPNVFFFGMIVVMGVGFAISLYLIRHKH
jgi:hypothetical protein